MRPLMVRREIAAPVTRVFEFATDFRNAPGRIRAIQKVEILTPGPTRVGTRFRETRRMFGRPATEELTVTAFEPGKRVALSATNCGCRYQSEFRFHEQAGRTLVEFEFPATPLSLLAKVLSVVFRPMLKKMVGECSKDLDDLARAAESDGAMG